MTHDDEQALDAMMRRVGIELTRTDDGVAHQSEAFLRWLAEDLRAGLNGVEREQDQRDAVEFAARMRAAQLVRRTELRLPLRELRHRTPPVVATGSQAVVMARKEQCAAMLDLAAAAGEGRELWDEPCESWLELPPDLPKSTYVGLGIAGDSMTPVLERNDVILVRLDARPAIDDVVVAQLAGGGYVVKRLAARSHDRIELASFNEEYVPIVARPDEVRVVGVVVARLARSS